MTQPIFVVGDRIRMRMRYEVPNASRLKGTVTTVFNSAHGYYDVRFDTAYQPRVCYADDLEHQPDERTLVLN